MDDFLRHIYTDILDHLEIKDPEYGENLRYAALQYDTLLQTLTPEQASHLRDYQGMTALAGQRKEEAVFRSAFQAGLYLGSLARPPYTRRSL
ncbi:hypothetical protein [Pseudoflavonifractor phocaeensis]|uniref:hypothetical protein n=1 Tax=Oscillospiraceae TaxID=216572 RepID=UPI0017484419|nr:MULTISPECIES: hypothetical protein [Oscillospiraceae]MBM6887512.1 hypothetical protein [Pseudoflavonifractor phocaeensis]